ncbi:MAG: sigma-70 family RNA polymerase sigma factor [Bacilli bacterium]
MENEFDQIYNRSYPFLLKYVIAKIDCISNAEDILQEVYLKLLLIIDRKGLSYIKNERKFLLKLTKNELYKYYSLREKFKSVFIRDDEVIDTLLLSDTQSNSNNDIDLKIDIKDIWDFISKEPIDVQKILCLYYLADCSIKSIALFLGMNESTVKTKLYRTRDKLREKYGRRL